MIYRAICKELNFTYISAKQAFVAGIVFTLVVGGLVWWVVTKIGG